MEIQAGSGHSTGRALAAASYGIYLVLLASYFCAPLYHPEYFFHLTIGQWIWDNGRLPTVDLWSLAGSGEAWRDPSWLFDVLVAGLDRLGGAVAVLGFKFVLFLLFLFVISELFRRKCQSKLVAGLLVSLVGAGVLSSGRFTGELIGWLVFLLLHERAGRVANGGLTGTVIVQTVCLVVLGAAVHPAVYAGIVSAGAFVALGSRVPGRTKFYWCLTLVGSCLISPYGGMQLVSVGGAELVEYLVRITLPVDPATPFRFSFALLLIEAAVIGILVFQEQRRPPQHLLLLWCIWGVIGWSAASYLSYAVLLGGLVLASLWAEVPQGTARLSEAINSVRRWLVAVDLRGPAWVALCLAIVNCWQLFYFPNMALRHLQILEATAKKFELAEKRLFNQPYHGGLLLYALSRAQPVGTGAPARVGFDERYFQLSPGWAADYEIVEKTGTGFQELFEKMKPEAVVCGQAGVVCSLVRERPAEWEPVSAFDGEDDTAPKDTTWRVYIRRRSAGGVDGAAASGADVGTALGASNNG
ncbi:MAG: hypothetical protein KDD44_04355 [Bdellovibrionales bacterium]|nr:hypothetical protein [Bdellovibrionales bacterium]